MKGKIKPVEVDLKTFKPFVLELTVESVGEARLLFHCFNRLDLLEVLRQSGGPNTELRYSFKRFSGEIAMMFTGTVYSEISRELVGQGLVV